jgi:hypothetical protein
MIPMVPMKVLASLLGVHVNWRRSICSLDAKRFYLDDLHKACTLNFARYSCN